MAKKYITQDMQRKKTLADIFTLILDRGQTTRRQIEGETGFSWGTVSAAVAHLSELGYIKEGKSASTGAGRTTGCLRPAADGYASIGVDINRSGLTYAVMALDSHVIHSQQYPFSAETQAELLAQVEQLCQQAIDWCAAQGLAVFSLGVAMQGTVDSRQVVAVRFPHVADWQPYGLREQLSRRFALPVYLGHDPTCMLLGELYRERCDSCVLVRVDDGIGMAIALDGRILDDTDRLELGHTLAVPEGRPCSCGQCGCLEAYASLSALPAVARETGDLFTAPTRYHEELMTAGEHLSVALYNIYVLFHPQQLILTGRATRLDAFTQGALSRLHQLPLTVTVDPEISAAQGAAAEAIRSAVKALQL